MAAGWGCSSTDKAQDRVLLATEHIEDPMRAIEARAELESLKPWKHIPEDLITAILPDAPAGLMPGSPAYQRALKGVDQIKLDLSLDMTDESSVLDDAQGALEPIGSERKIKAAKLYTQGRALEQGGQIGEAIQNYRQAARFDPGSATIERALGDALVLTNDQLGAYNAYTRARLLGDRSAGPLIHLASQAFENGEYDRVIGLVLQARGSSDLKPDSTARSIGAVLLGQSLIQQRYFKAGAQILGDALVSFDISARELQWKQELIGVLNHQPELWVRVGDAWASIGSFARAQNAYDRAGVDADFIAPLAVVARRLASDLRQGHPAQATLIYLDHLAKNATDLGDEEVLWAQTLSKVEGIREVLGPAIARLGDHPQRTNRSRQMLLVIELSTYDASAGFDRLAEVDALALTPDACFMVLSQVEQSDERFEQTTRLLESRPELIRSITPAFTRLIADPVAFMGSHASPQSSAQQLLIASIGIGMGRADLIEHLESLDKTMPLVAIDFSSVSTPWLSTHAQAFSLTGRWASADALLDELGDRWDSGDEEAGLELASSLIIAQQPTKAWRLIGQLADVSDASPQALVLAGRIAQTRLDGESAISYFERALEIDPADEYLYEQLIALHSNNERAPDDQDENQLEQQETRFLVRQLGTQRPRSTLFGLIRATELARSGMLDQAESALIELNERPSSNAVGLDLLLSLWKTQQTNGSLNAVADGVAWLDARLSINPNQVPTILAAAQGDYELDQTTQAFERLSQGYTRTGSFQIARALEQLIASLMEDPQRAQAHAFDRLDGLRGIDPTIEHAELLARMANPEAVDQLIELLKTNLPEDIEFLPTQQSQLMGMVFTLAKNSETSGTESRVLDAIDLLESRRALLHSTPTYLFELARIKALLASRLTDLDLADLMQLIEHQADQTSDPKQQEMLRTLPIQSLLAQERTNEAIMLTTMFATKSGVLDRQFMVDTFRLLGAMGTNADMLRVLDMIEEQNLMREAIELTTSALGTPSRGEVPTDADRQRADLAYTAAAMATAFDREEQAARYYELSLSYDKDHAWSNNDYGYMLAEKGERIEHAVDLLERAAQALPDEASIIDSLAWVRYKLGVFDDVVDESGKVITPGAISLLVRANELDKERSNATILLHLGDALWRGGYHDRAMTAWLDGENILRSQLRLTTTNANPNQRVVDALNSELSDIRYRLQDAESSGKPTLAPLATPETTPETTPGASDFFESD